MAVLIRWTVVTPTFIFRAVWLMLVPPFNKPLDLLLLEPVEWRSPAFLVASSQPCLHSFGERGCALVRQKRRASGTWLVPMWGARIDGLDVEVEIDAASIEFAEQVDEVLE